MQHHEIHIKSLEDTRQKNDRKTTKLSKWIVSLFFIIVFLFGWGCITYLPMEYTLVMLPFFIVAMIISCRLINLWYTNRKINTKIHQLDHKTK